jgi:regulator of cell morphogenesis and NO signaling
MTLHTPTLTPQSTLAELATTWPGAARVFHRHQLDFCCGGRASLADACRTRGLALEPLLAELAAEEARTRDFTAWDTQPLAALVDHVCERYHALHRTELARLVLAARKVEHVHADKPDRPRGLADHLAQLADELEQHMQKEEQVLFPLIRAGRGASAVMPVQVLEHEHKDHALNLARTRALAHDFVPPPEACNTWRALYLGLEELERDLMQHIHLENNVLFPRALRS